MKKFTLTLLALVCALCCAFGLAACGGAAKFSVEKFEDEGITYVTLYAASYDEYEKHKDDGNFNGFYSRGSCFEKYELPDGAFTRQLKIVNKYEPIKLGSGKWYGFVTVSLDNGYDLNDLKVEINGEEKEFLDFGGLGGVFGGNPFAEIGEFSGNTQIKLKGSTKLQTYQPAVTLKDYEANKDCQDAKDLRFKATVGGLPAAGGPPSYDTPFEYNSKTEFTATELKEALESKEFTYYQFVKVTAYFENKIKFFVDNSDAMAFFNADNSFVNLSIDNANKEVTFEFGCNMGYGYSITLEYSKLTTTPSIKGRYFDFSTATGDGASEANALYANSTITLYNDGTFSIYAPDYYGMYQTGTYTQNRGNVTLVITERTVNGTPDPNLEGSETIQCTYDGRNLVATYDKITLTYVDHTPS